MQIESAKDLDVYKLANEFAMEIFELTKSFPSEEKYALTSQIRRSSRFNLFESSRSVGKEALCSAFCE